MNPLNKSKLYSKSFFFVLVSILLLSNLPSYKNVISEDYMIFTVGGANSGIDLTYVFEDKLYVVNNTYVLQYDLENETLEDSINLGGSVTVNEIKGKHNELYLNITDGGVDKLTIITLDTFTREDTVDASKLSFYTNDLNNLVWITYGGIHYWAYTRYNWTSAGSEAYLTNPQQVTYKGYDTSETYERIYAFSCFHWSTNAFSVTPKQVVFVYNATSDAEMNTSWSGSAYFGGNKMISSRRLLTSALDGTPFSKSYGNKDNKYALAPSYNLDMLLTGTDLSISWLRGGVREQTYDVFTYDMEDGGASGKLHYWADLEDKWFKLRYNAPTEIKVASYTSSAFGSVTTLTAPNSINIVAQSFIDGVFTVNYFQDETNTKCTYLAFVDTNNVPRAYKIVGSSLLSVGVLTAYTPTKTNVFRSDVNFVAVFTISGSSDLFVCKNLIEDQYVYISYGVQIIAQLYRVYDVSDNILLYVKFMLNDTWYTALDGEPYYFYLDDVYQKTGTLDTNGMLSISFAVITPPNILSFYANMTGYTGKWFNVTVYSSTMIDVTETEEPVLSLDAIDHADANTLRISTYIRRFTGELLSNYYFDTNPKIAINVKEYGLGGYYHEYNLDAIEVADGLLSTSLGYTQPNTYLVTFSYNASEQNTFLYNTTSNTNVFLTFDSTTKNIVIGGIVVLPTPPTPIEEEPIGIISTVGIISLANWLPTIILVLMPSIIFVGMGIKASVNSGTLILLMILGLNIGVGIGNMVGLIPFYFMITMFLLDAIIFIFMLKSGGRE